MLGGGTILGAVVLIAWELARGARSRNTAPRSRS